MGVSDKTVSAFDLKIGMKPLEMHSREAKSLRLPLDTLRIAKLLVKVKYMVSVLVRHQPNWVSSFRSSSDNILTVPLQRKAFSEKNEVSQSMEGFEMHRFKHICCLCAQACNLHSPTPFPQTEISPRWTKETNKIISSSNLPCAPLCKYSTITARFVLLSWRALDFFGKILSIFLKSLIGVLHLID